MNILVTGGAGYIGSHACKRLLELGHRVVVIDNLSRGHINAIDRLRTLKGVTPERLVFQAGDAGDRIMVETLLRQFRIDTIMHFAALAYVRESMEQPLAYFRNNTAAAAHLLEAADAAGVERFVFSSTCATYGEAPPDRIPIREDCPQHPINPYGWSKLFVERMLIEYAGLRRRQARPLGIAMLRYFNVAGCDRANVIGEDHQPETHIIPIMLQVALGQRDAFTILGTDHPTPDGTCVRDYIHVEDLVGAHIAVMEALKPGDLRAYNLGIGRGYSVKEVHEAAQRITGKKIPTKAGLRHPGDPPTLFCDPSLIKRDLGWAASIKTIEEIIQSAWAWFKAHPKGYQS